MLCPAYLAPVSPTKGLFTAVPAAIFVGTPAAGEADAPAFAGFWAALLGALFTMCIVLPSLIL